MTMRACGPIALPALLFLAACGAALPPVPGSVPDSGGPWIGGTRGVTAVPGSPPVPFDPAGIAGPAVNPGVLSGPDSAGGYPAGVTAAGPLSTVPSTGLVYGVVDSERVTAVVDDERVTGEITDDWVTGEVNDDRVTGEVDSERHYAVIDE